MILIVIDGKFRIVEQRQTVLEAAKTCGLEIPSLCGLNKTGDKVPCDLCVVEVDGVGMTRSCELEVSNGLNITTQSKQLTSHRQGALNRIMADHYADCEAPCQTACPKGVDIQSYLHHIAQRDEMPAEDYEIEKRSMKVLSSTF